MLAQVKLLTRRLQLSLHVCLFFREFFVGEALRLGIKFCFISLLGDLLVFLLKHADDRHLYLAVNDTTLASG